MQLKIMKNKLKCYNNKQFNKIKQCHIGPHC